MMKHKVWILTLTPSYYTPFLETGVVGKALRGERGETAFELFCVFLGDYSPKGYKGVDDAPYGGGQGMVMRADVLKEALLKGVVEKGGYGEEWREKIEVILPSPGGRFGRMRMPKRFHAAIGGKGPRIWFLCVDGTMGWISALSMLM